ncbi:hypothetical protein ANANG_G00097720 [Anguilla anguilla]|uniref:RING-type domain-containing protein n=1 Tax=Anguilla anguilla TaxID=7936 RepID=A0A9D3S0T8_ANGAN|nr:hypothetical protein ANANG_G00097720 [Anguilla anguilla]
MREKLIHKGHQRHSHAGGIRANQTGADVRAFSFIVAAAERPARSRRVPAETCRLLTLPSPRPDDRPDGRLPTSRARNTCNWTRYGGFHSGTVQGQPPLLKGTAFGAESPGEARRMFSSFRSERSARLTPHSWTLPLSPGPWPPGQNSARYAVCLEEFKQKDELGICPCKHAFHRKCLIKWLEVRKVCPLCNMPVLQLAQQQGGAEAQGPTQQPLPGVENLV